VRLRYETALTDAARAVIGPLMPTPAPCVRPPLWTIRAVLNALFHVLRTVVSWRLIPKICQCARPLSAASSAGATGGCSARSTTPSSCWIARGSDGKPHRPPRPSTAKASRRRKAVVRAATRPARGSTGASAKRRSTWTGALVLDPQPADRQDRDAEPCGCCACRVGSPRSLPRPSPMQAMRATCVGDRRGPLTRGRRRSRRGRASDYAGLGRGVQRARSGRADRRQGAPGSPAPERRAAGGAAQAGRAGADADRPRGGPLAAGRSRPDPVRGSRRLGVSVSRCLGVSVSEQTLMRISIRYINGAWMRLISDS
jgi:transposase